MAQARAIAMIFVVIRALVVMLLGGCVANAPHPYRFSSPLMGAADVPMSWQPAEAQPAPAVKPDDTIQVQDGIHLEPEPKLVAN
ncbi:MAG: hypothetical protein QM831_42350 [Kofleriaceae bacterium]